MQRCIGIAVILALFAPLSLAATDAKPAAPSAAERMQLPGPEEQQLKRRTGTWTVKVTFRPTSEVEGRMIRSNLEIVRENDDHEFVRQYWVQADGSARRWLAVEYEYTRRK